MNFILAICVGVLALFLPVTAHTIARFNEAAAICAKGFCTSCPLAQNQCTLMTRKHGNTPQDAAVDIYIYRWDCNSAGNAINIKASQPVFNFFSQLPFTIVLDNLGSDPNFRYGGTYYNNPVCYPSLGTWQCVQQFGC